VLEGIDKRGVGVGKATSSRAKVIYTRRCHVNVIGKEEQRGRRGGPCVCFILRHSERRAEPGASGFRCSASNRGDGSVYDRDDIYVDAGSGYDQAFS
jgi:hypothetical protein